MHCWTCTIRAGADNQDDGGSGVSVRWWTQDTGSLLTQLCPRPRPALSSPRYCNSVTDPKISRISNCRLGPAHIITVNTNQRSENREWDESGWFPSQSLHKVNSNSYCNVQTSGRETVRKRGRRGCKSSSGHLSWQIVRDIWSWNNFVRLPIKRLLSRSSWRKGKWAVFFSRVTRSRSKRLNWVSEPVETGSKARSRVLLTVGPV